MRAMLAAILLSFCSGALAQTWLTASLASYHFERRGYCEINPGIGLEHEISRTARFLAGSYQNSFCRSSAYVGASYMPISFSGLRAGVALTGVTGYETDKNAKRDRMIWAALPAIAYEGKRRGVNLVLVPPYTDFKGAIGLQVKVRLE